MAQDLVDELEEEVRELSDENVKLRGLVLKVAAERLPLEEAMQELGKL